MTSSETFTSRWVVSFDFHVGIAKINFNYIAFFILNIYREFFRTFWGSKWLVQSLILFFSNYLVCEVDNNHFTYIHLKARRALRKVFLKKIFVEMGWVFLKKLDKKKSGE